MAGTAVINRYPIAAGPLPVAGTVTVAADGGGTDTPVSVGFKPSFVILIKDPVSANTDRTYMWHAGMGANTVVIGAVVGNGSLVTAGSLITHYDGADAAAAGFTIAAGVHAHSDVIHFIAFP